MKDSSDDLISTRKQLYKTIIDYFVERTGVEALYIQGSVAESRADEWSDIDFRVVIQLKYNQQYVSDHISAPVQWGD